MNKRKSVKETQKYYEEGKYKEKNIYDINEALDELFEEIEKIKKALGIA
jgi:hypothetical protein